MSSSDLSSEEEVSNRNEEPEFYDSTVRRPPISKDSAWMGVFGDEEEEYVKKGPSSNLLNSNLRFVKVETTTKKDSDSESDSSEDKPQRRMRDDEEFEEDFKPSFSNPAINSFTSMPIQEKTYSLEKNSFSFQTSKNKAGKPNVSKGQKNSLPTQPLKKEYAAFLNNPQGNIIKNMMAKMGFQEGRGLGPDGSGRIEPIEVKLRSKKAGIGFGARETPVRESSSESDDKEDVPKENRPIRPKRSKIQYRNLEEAMARVETIIPKVLDMTGPETKELGSIQDASSFNTTTDTLGDDIRLVIDLSKDGLFQLEQEMKSLNLQRRVLVQEVEALQPLLDQSQKDEKVLLDLSLLCSQLQALNFNSDPSNFIQLIPHLTKLQEYIDNISSASQLKTFMTLKISELAVSLIIPLFRNFVSSWDPSSEPTLMADFFTEWNRLFFTSDNMSQTGPESLVLDSNICMSPYDTLMYHIWLPKVRSFLINEWDPCSYDSVIILFQTWSPLLSSSIYDHLINQYLFPKLQATLEAWNPKPNAEPFHLWLHPWLPFLVDRLDELRPLIRSKLASIIRISEQFNESISIPEIYFQPWFQILSSKDLNKLWKAAEAKLQQDISHFDIDPSDQDIVPFLRILTWYAFMPAAKFDSILNTFFDSWLNVLAQWLSMEPPLTEVMRWYNYWKSILPKASINTSIVDSNLRKALIHINQYIDTNGNTS